MTANYQDSLHLPKTNFPMKAALAKREPSLVAEWETTQLYKAVRHKHQTHPTYLLHDGPPYANGHLHIGHAVNKILKDIITKSKSLSGFNAPFVPGWDCHGLPIELNVEKQFASKKITYTAKAFRQACREYANEQIAIQKKEFKRLGILADWDHPYLTMDYPVQADTMRALGQCLQTGYLEAGLKPIHWCVACKSALAELEVNYKDKQAIAIDVKFEVIDRNHSSDTFLGYGPLFIPIWTTTPWTLPANEAVAIGPKIEYTLVQLEKERLLLATPLYQLCLSRYGIKDYTVLGTYSSQYLEGLRLAHPLDNRLVPLIISGHVSTSKGTGAVHIAPSHGPEDYQLSLEHQLPLRTLVDDKGRYQLEDTRLNGQPVLHSDPLILDRLSQDNALLAQQALTHSYPHCWRHHIPLIFRATPQWFLKLGNESLYQSFNKALTQVQWIPEWGRARMRTMLGESYKTARPDWCLSRQRNWGVPLPLFVHKKTLALHPNTVILIEHIAQQVEKEGVEAWYRIDPKALLKDEAEHYDKLTDVLDVWFDSGVTHHTVLNKRYALNRPADLYVEGSDQFRGWFQSSFITSAILNKTAPYRCVLSHGFTVDTKGQKMSKSLGNTVPLDQIIERWGADILRLWVAATDTHSEITVSDETFERISDAYRRIRNTLRFLLGNLHDFHPDEHILETHQLLSFDRWLLTRVKTTQTVIQTAYESFNFPMVYQTIHHFCVYELGSLYLSILKDRQYTMQANSLGRRSGQTVLYHTIHCLVRWLAPILSFTADEVWKQLTETHTTSVFLAEWYTVEIDETSDPLSHFYQEAGGCEACWSMIIKTRETVNQAIETARNQGRIGSALEANLLVYCYPTSLLGRLLVTMQKELPFIFLCSTVNIVLSQEKAPSEKEVAVSITPSDTTQMKCGRCWHRCYDVGQDIDHPMLCHRCIQNLPEGEGESRYYA